MTSKVLAARTGGKMIPWRPEIGTLMTERDKEPSTMYECDTVDVDILPVDIFQVVPVKV